MSGAGHEALVAAPAALESAVTPTGAGFWAFGDPDPAEMAAVYGKLPTASREEANRLVCAEIFGRLGARTRGTGPVARVGGEACRGEHPEGIADVMAVSAQSARHTLLTAFLNGTYSSTSSACARVQVIASPPASNAATSRRIATSTVVGNASWGQITSVGVGISPDCNPNYSGCVPNASDVDCEGGSGDGPAYVSGPIRVIGTDVYRLDNDKDGVACE